MNYTKRFPLWLLSLACAATISMTACTDEDGEPNGGNQNGKETVSDYDDLAYFQNAIVEVDSAGNMLCRSYGEVLDDSDPDHLYIAVDNLAEAETIFRQWIAPDVKLTTAIPTTGGLTCPLTDMEGKAQGTVYFNPGTGTSVAEVTASSGTKLLHFSRITFLHNSAWPLNESIYQHYTEGDIITYSPKVTYTDIFGTEYNSFGKSDQTLKWVCIRQGSKGVKPMFCAITNGNYNCYNSSSSISYPIHESSYCPGEAKATAISNLLKASWDIYVLLFDQAGCGKLDENQEYWIDKSNWSRHFWMKYRTGQMIEATGAREVYRPFLLKIDWLDDDAIRSSMIGTAGSAPVQSHEKYISLFDGLQSTKWCTFKDWKTKSINGVDDVWFVEFQANAPVWPTGYKITTGNDCEEYHGRNPKAWKLYAKPNIDDDWELISEVGNGGMADVNCKTYSYTISEPSYYMYFRMEISSNVSGGHMQFSELSLITINPEE